MPTFFCRRKQIMVYLMHCVIAWVREMNGLKGNKKKWIGAVLGIVLGAVILFLPPPQGLSRDAMALMGVLVFAVCYWVFDVFPDYVVALMMCVLWVALGAVPFESAFYSFSQENYWLFFGAFALAA